MAIKISAKEFQRLIEDQRSKGQITTKKDLHCAQVPKGQDYRYVARQGWSVVGEKKCYFRSEWERKFACYLQWEKEQGHISDWQHEPETFWFKEIKRGVRSYLPDFKVFERDETFYYYEVKGYFDSRSKTKIKRFNKYYPDNKLVVIDKKWFAQNKNLASIVPGWNYSL